MLLPRPVLRPPLSHLRSALSQARRARGVHMLRDLPPVTHAQLADTDKTRKPRLLPIDGAPRSAPAAFSPSHHLCQWTRPPESVLLVQKKDDSRVQAAMAEILGFLTTHYPHLRLIVEPHTAREQSQFPNLTVFNEITDSPVKLLDNTDFVITLGGDGTVLHASQLFSRTECPPVLCFSLGSLGFLLPFKVQDIDRALHYILGDGEVEILNRMRLNALAVDSQGRTLSRMPESGWQVMNEVCLHRGRYPHLPSVDVYYNNQHLTKGLVSLRAVHTKLTTGGRLPPLYPNWINSLLIIGWRVAHASRDRRRHADPDRTPVIVIPTTGPAGRRTSEARQVSLDGRDVCELHAEESVLIRKSIYPIPCVDQPGGGTGWVRDINSTKH
ncbi:hypothetical protein A1Q1_00048 [Trichosporon asahii var. asahii CBS 2479]|uniref:NADH kinase n=1 Tax=Trichosporon asahii var. asahii (strain ATCC 90039 / CBS 2479 / JCM 2466 / KCTC 7840 / NBRC 103889/ NCYC 2677 / UAMH 7654) TaxID=1186058 RepID=J8TII7_TRIAS|nr:hypothetical protein A1Q1_00048 [Trichosporon asahii var. asahii CBS 2479]EJT53041.1 hypothetical protein A1Q1_00048 [Trichosporon asahii var. asahii CBS 2479]